MNNPAVPNSRFRHLCESVAPFYCVGFPILVPVVVLIGWSTRIAPLTNFFTGAVAMNPVVAVFFILCAVLLGFSWKQPVSPKIARCRFWFSGLVIAVCGTKLIGQIAGHDLFIDQIFFSARLDLVPNMPPNRMAPNTALSMILSACALTTIDRTNKDRRPSELLALTSMLIALLGILGYIYGVAPLYHVQRFIPMALHAGFCFIALDAGILLARNDVGVMGIATSNGAGGVLARRLLPFALLMPPCLGWFGLQAQRLNVIDTRMGVSVLVIAISLSFVILIWSTAGLLRSADELLRQRNSELEKAMNKLREAQSQLVQAEKLAGLGQMVAGIAHEINNPLSFVANNVAVINRDVMGMKRVIELYRQADAHLAAAQPDLAAKIQERAQEIDLDYTVQNLEDITASSREGLRRIQQIVCDLRDFARLDQDENQQADLNAGIQSTINIITGHAKRQKIELVTELGNLPIVECFPAKLNQVVMNLISNAIDASSEGGKVIIRSIANDRDIRIEVIDNGCGMSPQTREKIFDPFFTTKPQGQGMGLGLSISYGIVREHKGTLQVESELGKGSRFILTLPKPRLAA
jgi:signal transduction histidine kinase